MLPLGDLRVIDPALPLTEYIKVTIDSDVATSGCDVE
jgi:hypothetical protein